MGDPRRFDLFAKWIANNFPKAEKVADVAGGKGYLSLALKEHKINSICFEPKKRQKNVNKNKVKINRRRFNERINEDFDLLVGMHPDEATDVIIVEAAKRGVPFAIVPCCVKPWAITFWGKHCFGGWVKHLTREAEEMGYEVTEHYLKMSGKNLVLKGVPRS